MNVNTKNIGRQAVIAATNFPQHAHMIGQAGTITKAIKSRNVYCLRLNSGKTWEAMPQNVTLRDQNGPC